MTRRSTKFLAISEFPKGRKHLISLSFRGKSSVRPAQVGRFDVNIVIHGSTAVRGRGDLVAYGWALWKLPAPWTHRTRPPHLGKRCAFSRPARQAARTRGSSTAVPARAGDSPATLADGAMRAGRGRSARSGPGIDDDRPHADERSSIRSDSSVLAASELAEHPSRLLKKSVKWDRQIDPGVLPCSRHF